MPNVPLLDLKAQYATIRSEVREAIDRVCDAQHFILGPEVARLEEELAAFCGTRFAIGVSSGTDALLVALMAIGVGSGDQVIIPAYSFFATAGVVARLGATPIFVDIDERTFNLDPAQVIASITPRTKAVMPVHLFGRCADIEPVLEATARYGIPVIEDAAQALGARDDNGRNAGSMASVGCFSFFPSKNLGGFGDGGLVATNDEELAKTIRVLRVHGSDPKYYHRLVGGNFRLDALQAAVLRVKLNYLPAWNDARREHAAAYRRLFQERGPRGVILPEDTPHHIYNQFVGRFPMRDRLRDFLKGRGVETEIYYPVPLPYQECFGALGHVKGEFPRAEAASAASLALPVYPELTEAQQRYVVDAIYDYYRQLV